MAIAVDDTTVARVTMSKLSGTGQPINATTATFTAPANSLLVVCIGTDTNTPNAQTLTMSNNGAALTWTTQVQRDDSEGEGGACFIATAPVSSERVGLTVTASVAGHQISNADDRGSFKVYIVTGQDLVDPIGNVAEGSSTTNAITPNTYTSSANNSRGFASATEWNALGTPTSTDTESGFTMTALSGLSLYKAADTPTSGTVVTMNFDAAAGSAIWNWVALEILPAAGGGGGNAPRSMYYHLHGLR